MKKTISLLLLIITMVINGVSADAKGSKANDGKPLTQYVFVQADSDGATLRDASDMSRILKSYGFTVSSVKMQGNKEIFTASRNGTTIKYVNVEGDSKCTITFRTQAEVNTFVESLFNSHWIKKGSRYEHPNNNYAMDCTTIFASVNGRTVVLDAPF